MRSAALPGAERIPIEGGAHVRLFMIQSSLSLHYCTTGIGSGRNSSSLEARLHMGLQEGRGTGYEGNGVGIRGLWHTGWIRVEMLPTSQT